MRSLFAAEGRNCIAVSLDDFYLTGAGQDAVGVQYNGNSLLEFRGNGNNKMSAICYCYIVHYFTSKL